MYRMGVLTVLLLSSILWSSSGQAQSYESFGSDVYVSGSSPELVSDSPRDAFIAGFSPTNNATVAGDLHIAGFNATAQGTVGKDLYAAATNIIVNAEIGQDLSVAGFTITLNSSAAIGGNARILAGTATINAPVGNSLIASGGEIILNAAVVGDVKITAASIGFGKNAKIGGKLIYASNSEQTIPASVISADRIQRIPFSRDHTLRDAKETFDKTIPGLWPSVFTRITGLIITLVFLLVIAAVFQSFMPNKVQQLRESIQRHPGRAVLTGFLGLSMLVGLIPVSAITLIGIPFIPVVLLFIVMSWILGYLLGAYVLSMRLFASFSDEPDETLGKMMVLSGGLVILVLLNFIPILGWLFNLSVVLVGIGALTSMSLQQVLRER